MKIKIYSIIIALSFFAFKISAKHISRVPNLKNKHAIVKRYSLEEMQKNIQYEFAVATVKQSYYSRLDQLAELLIQNKYPVALRGYADSIGKYKANWVLSQKRADAISAYLVSKGVPQNLIVATAFGSTNPIATNKTAYGREQNRRVEIKVKKPNDQVAALSK